MSVTILTLLALAMSALMLGFVQWEEKSKACITLLSSRYLVSAFFSKANLATLCAILIYFISYLPFILVMFLEAKMQIIHKLLIVSDERRDFDVSIDSLSE
jgi:hypothetical protein